MILKILWFVKMVFLLWEENVTFQKNHISFQGNGFCGALLWEFKISNVKSFETNLYQNLNSYKNFSVFHSVSQATQLQIHL